MSCNNSTSIFLLGLVSAMTSDIRASDINQQQFMTFAYAFSVTVLVVFALISNILSINTFYRARIRTTTVGFYLIIYSYCSIFGILMLECRLIRMLNSFSYIASFLICNIIAQLSSIFTHVGLWMNALIAVQRSMQSFEPNDLLNRICSRPAAQKQILIVIICVTLMHIHELIYRVSVPDPLLQQNFICKIEYTPSLMTMNTIFRCIHLFVPFSLNILANCLVLASISRRRATLHQTLYWTQWMRQFRHHRHLFLAPTLTMICTLPQLILSLLFSCVDISFKWLLRSNIAANLIIYLPQAATFFVFILFSKSYFEVFKTQSYLGKLLFRRWSSHHRVVPQLKTADHPLVLIPNKNLVELIEHHQLSKV